MQATNKPLSNHKKLSILAVIVLSLLLANKSFGHTVNYSLEQAPTEHVVLFYLRLGFSHIIPQGLDHILFIVGLCLLSHRMKVIVWQATAFTIAHSITLALSMKGIIVAPSTIVEVIIAASILFVAIENILLTELKPWRIALVFVFGLIHGLGFASSLNEIGLPRNQFTLSILSFNIGVELGQLCIILAVFVLLIKPFGKKAFYRQRIIYPLSITIAAMAVYWIIERLFFG
jgi:hypothetical protein